MGWHIFPIHGSLKKVVQFPIKILINCHHLAQGSYRGIRSYLKNTSDTQLPCCWPPQNAHILPCMLRFFVGPRLVLERNLHFWDSFLLANDVWRVSNNLLSIFIFQWIAMSMPGGLSLWGICETVRWTIISAVYYYFFLCIHNDMTAYIWWFHQVHLVISLCVIKRYHRLISSYLQNSAQINGFTIFCRAKALSAETKNLRYQLAWELPFVKKIRFVIHVQSFTNKESARL